MTTIAKKIIAFYKGHVIVIIFFNDSSQLLGVINSVSFKLSTLYIELRCRKFFNYL